MKSHSKRTPARATKAARKTTAPKTAARTPAAKSARALIVQATRDVSFVHPALGTQIAVKRGKFCVTLSILNRDTGEPCGLYFSWNLPPLLMSREHAINWIYGCVRDAWVHELNETLFVDGKRRRDLHDEEGHAIAPPEDARASDLSSFKVQLATFLSTIAPVTKGPRSELDGFKMQLSAFLMGAPQ